jgi:hypothetical protein
VNHSDIRARMADYLEGDLPLEDRALFDAHLDVCDQCDRELEELQAAIALLRSLPDPEPPDDLVDVVMRRIRAGEGRLTVVDRVREWLSSLAAPGFAIPATAVATALAIALLSGQLDLAQLGLGSPQAPKIAAVRPARVQGVRPVPSEPSARSTPEMRVASNLSPTAPPAPASQGVVARPRPVADASRHTAPADPSGTRTHVRIRIAQNHPTAGPTSAGDPLRSSSTLPTGVLVGASSVPETASARAAGAPIFGPSESPGLRSRDYATSPPDSASVASSRDSEERARAEFRRRELDLRLSFLLRSPEAFAAEFADLSAGEQDLWLRAIAEHAVESQVADRVVSSLRATGDARAQSLAAAFAADLRELRRDEP